MSLEQYRYDGSKKVKLDKAPTSARAMGLNREQVVEKTQQNKLEIASLQDRLYAEGLEGVVVIFQAMDAAGKDSAIKHVMSAVNPQGIMVHNFKQPTSQDLSHDFLWRAVQCLPARGNMAIFNRSYYEDVLIVKVRNLHKTYHMAPRVLDDPEFFEKRYRQIRHFESYLYENSYRVVKFFLHVSAKKQKQRFLERIERKEKNWKFSSSDIKERALWNDYQEAFEDAINATATKNNPWFVLPADNKWYTRYLISEAMRQVLEQVDPHYPVVTEAKEKELELCRQQLISNINNL